MSLYVKVFTNFYTHRKTLRLRAAIGDDAFWIPPRLWAYAAENQPDGNFADYSDSEIASVIGYLKDASSLLQALQKAGFVDLDRKIHDWEHYNAYHKVYSERARKGGLAKAEKERTKENNRTDTEKRRQEPSTASSTASSRNGDKSPTISLSSISEKEQVEYELNAHRLCLKGTPQEDRKERARHTKAIERLETLLSQFNDPNNGIVSVNNT